jgi:hypothetical protein
MKKLGFIGLFILLGVSFNSCNKEDCLEGDNYPRGAVRVLEPFNAIDVKLSAIVELVSDTTTFVEIVVEENLETHLSTNVNNEVLTIALGFCFSNHSDIVLRVHYDTLNTITVSGPGDVFSKTIMQQDELKLHVLSSGNINITANAKNVNSIIDGTGVITINGQVSKHTITHNNSGNVNTYQTATDTAIVNLMGNGNAYLRVSKDLNVTIQGNGSVFYKGFPDITENITGKGMLVDEN